VARKPDIICYHTFTSRCLRFSDMEHLPIPRHPYATIKVPFLKRTYSPPDADSSFKHYPERRGWDFGAAKTLINNYKHLETNYYDPSISHALGFLERLLDQSFPWRRREQDVLRYGISILKKIQEKTGPGAEQTRIRTGAEALDRAVHVARGNEGSRAQLVEAMRERRMLDLVAVFTNETFTSNNQSSKYVVWVTSHVWQTARDTSRVRGCLPIRKTRHSWK
jgi:hypothetical protein